MGSQQKITFNNLKSNISDSIKESCQTADATICKIAGEVYHINTVTVEPGVEIVEGLSTIIDETIKDSVRSGCDLSVVSKGILIGAFRSNPSIQLEAHKTIRLLVQGIVQGVFKYKGDIKQAVDGLLAGIVTIAKEHKLNVREALIIVTEDILFSAKALNPEFAGDIEVMLPKEYL